MKYDKIITVDLDGVVVGGNYLPEWDRSPSNYAVLKPIDGAVDGLWYLKNQGWRIYYLSARNFPDAFNTTYNWLSNVGAPTGDGIILKVPLEYKGFVSKALGARAHIDDAPRALDAIESHVVKPILFVGRDESGWWEGTKEAMRCFPSFHDWKRLVQYVEGLV